MRPIIDDFCQIRRNSDVRFERAYCWRRKGSKQDLCYVMYIGALLMYAAVAIIPAASSFPQTRPIIHTNSSGGSVVFYVRVLYCLNAP